MLNFLGLAYETVRNLIRLILGPGLIKIMINGKSFRQVLDKFLKSPVSQNARVQVVLPTGEYCDISSVQLLENKLLGARETHRLVITIESEKWRMGIPIKKL